MLKSLAMPLLLPVPARIVLMGFKCTSYGALANIKGG